MFRRLSWHRKKSRGVRVEQIRVSHNVRFFGDRMTRKFKLRLFDDPQKPTVMYGVYNASDYEFFEKSEVPIIALWRGTDAKVVTENKAKIILSRNDVKHYAASPCVQRSLKAWGIHSEFLPITSTDVNIKNEKRGKCVYAYIASRTNVMRERYRLGVLRRLEATTRIRFIYTYLYQYPFDKLMEVYRRCFVGIRLLGHDGLSNSILEMGLMGRRTISNSGLPYTISWKKESDIRDAIIHEYKNRLDDNTEISRAYRKLIDIGDAWLELQ